MYKSMTTTGNITIPDLYDPILLPIHEELCGDSYSFQPTRHEFTKFLNVEPNKSIMQATSVSDGTHQLATGLLFRKFLDNGKNCHETSFLARTQTSVKEIALGQNPQSRYTLWQPHLARFIEFIEVLAERLSRTSISGKISTRLQNSIYIAARRLHLWGEETDKLVKEIFMQNGKRDTLGIEDEFIKAQWRAMGYPLMIAVDIMNKIPYGAIQFPYVNIIPIDISEIYDSLIVKQNPLKTSTVQIDSIDSSSPMRKVEHRIAIERSLIKNALSSLANPLHWINAVYESHMNYSSINVQVATSQNIPDIAPAKPDVVRQIIDSFMKLAAYYAGKKQDGKTVKIKFSWYEQDGQILAKMLSDDLWGMLKYEQWKPIELMIMKTLGSFWDVYPGDKEGDPPMLAIRIPLKPGEPQKGGNMPPVIKPGPVNSGTTTIMYGTPFMPNLIQPPSHLMMMSGRQVYNAARPAMIFAKRAPLATHLL